MGLRRVQPKDRAAELGSFMLDDRGEEALDVGVDAIVEGGG